MLLARAAGEQTSDNLSLPGTGSTDAPPTCSRRSCPKQAYGTNPLVLQSQQRQAHRLEVTPRPIDETVNALKKAPHVIRGRQPAASRRAGRAQQGQEDRLHLGHPRRGPERPHRGGGPGPSSTQPIRPSDAGLEVAVGGYVGQAVSKPDTESSEAIGLAAAVVILLFAFGTATAMALPIVTAVLGLASVALAHQAARARRRGAEPSPPRSRTMIGLGVGIDYALFIVTRHKLQLNDGMEMRESIARATATAGGAVVFAGTTVVIALCRCSPRGIPLVGTLGYSAGGRGGGRGARPPRRCCPRCSARSARASTRCASSSAAPTPTTTSRTAGRAGPRGVADRPWRSLVAAWLILVVLALPVLNLELGQSDTGALPKYTTARQAYDLITEGFGAGRQRPAADRRPARQPGQGRPEEAQPDRAEAEAAQPAAAAEQTAAARARGRPPDQAEQQAKQQARQQTRQQRSSTSRRSRPSRRPPTRA